MIGSRLKQINTSIVVHTVSEAFGIDRTRSQSLQFLICHGHCCIDAKVDRLRRRGSGATGDWVG